MFRPFLMATAILTAVACGTDQPTPEPETSSKSSASYDATLACGAAHDGWFDGYTNNETYPLAGGEGVVYTFELWGNHSPSYGVGIAVVDQATGELLLNESVSWSNDITVEFTSKRDTTYDVILYTPWSGTTGSYTLIVDCMLTNLPDCSPEPPSYGCYYDCADGYYIGSWGPTCGCC